MKALPSIDVLKTFLVVAQKLNFTRAADVLNLTQGAVSRQISGLESHLGYALFVRQARGLALTPHGAILLAPLQQAFAQIGEALAKSGAQSGTLRVKCPTCAMRWILPRVIRLQNERPELVVEVTAAVSHGVEFNAEQFDAAIVFGKPTVKGVSTHHLFDEVLTPVCAPGLWKGKKGRAATPDDLADKTLLHPTRDRRDWLRWLEAYGYRGLPSTKAQHFDTLDLAISSAMQGLGVTIGDLSLIDEDLRAKRIVTPFSLCVPSGAAYYLIYPERPAPSPALQQFAEWLEDEAAQTRASLSAYLQAA
ncbi:LysR family transcriptional regulator [Caballeronia arationis]|jgi:LysR family glycine cleavage system transcriptional activator|uniref:DNA-binding transcriptional regulator, LysR family n=1 Tax=Caballeronia arationis TaxID=1777142 RepID=A0A7Z7I4Y3_9BURK|nr:LysR substrate-binding domain-containing protein [Caballeronia arationis]SAK75464.1 LysR family transcriptional regulator [Caballeronia arationis]SOE62966.1 DNA-binding transcriptional regulator, LysR family [Caballeronia arationis]